jgi:hypothetical protein
MERSTARHDPRRRLRRLVLCLGLVTSLVVAAPSTASADRAVLPFDGGQPAPCVQTACTNSSWST